MCARIGHTQIEHTQIEHSNKKTGWAIDIRNVSAATTAAWRVEGYIPEHDEFEYQMKRYPAKVACLMSHTRVWEQLAEEANPDAFYLILEDDANPIPGFDAQYKGVLKELRGEDWDWVFLSIHPRFAKLNTNVIDGKMLINRAPPMVGNAGYLLSRQGAHKLLRQVSQFIKTHTHNRTSNTPDVHARKFTNATSNQWQLGSSQLRACCV
jgi:GR25 family glycosyltransferase involved in LPS biosynthesis